ncbi:energy transducer TonB [Stenotrophomonas sp. ESTM1D_MKCIP4_1]|uniref:energy transducer TonB n=1 Tax=Stenotrophomonas sp. ESTM1D_MKCIP4_1 TaxID=2072414 RepID=UPI000D53D5AF|nr:energy transducer TonB [Stenotrophomonas sp. ESTM1D_MKCIP4_1]AWH54615.1 energy transducer TonB [Stenotrophomonas sp. ESTM1D_MKCIP4_1]
MNTLRRWATSLAIVLLAHALLITAVWWWHARAVPVTAVAPPAALMLELAPTVQAPPAPPRALPTGPLQQEQQRRETLPEQPPAPKVPPRPQGDLQPKPQVPANTVQDSAEVNVDRTTAPPEVPADAALRYAAAQTTAGERSRANATWQGLLLGHLQQHRRYPRQSERLRQQGVAYVRFAVFRDGRVSAARIERSSGFALLDQETLDTVQRASPVPAPPAEVAGDPVEVMVPVAFYLRGR